MPPAKPAVLTQILATLNAELEVLTRGARASFAAATDPDSKAENKYDTRTLEASYVARGQARRVAELEAAIQAFGQLSGAPFIAGAAITMGALVSLSTAGGTDHYFLGPAAGGTEVALGGTEILVITPAAPLGRALMGKHAGDPVTLPTGQIATVQAVA